MRLLFDENLSPAHAGKARERGHDATAILDVGLSGESDERVRAYAIAEDRILVTLDADFANILRFPPKDTPGVIRLRLHPPTETAIAHLLSWALSRLQSMSLRGRLAVVEPSRIRVR